MLIKYDYAKINDDWNKKISECCQSNQSDVDKSEDCCYDTWKSELDRITPAYNHTVESAGQLQSRVDFITRRRDNYKIWIDELEKANTLSKDICDQLKLISVQTDKIWYNSCKAVEAIEILFCMIRDIFMETDKIKKIYDDLNNCITRSNDPALVSGQGILKYLEEYKQKLDATVKSREEIIRNIIEAIRISNLLRNSISTNECPEKDNDVNCKSSDNQLQPCFPDGDKNFYGFKTVICESYREFSCTKCGAHAEQQNSKENKSETTSNAGATKGKCKSGECEDLDSFDFPICNDSYKQNVKDWVKKDEECLNDLVKKLNEAKIQKEALLACKNSLDSAIKAVDPKERCK